MKAFITPLITIIFLLSLFLFPITSSYAQETIGGCDADDQVCKAGADISGDGLGRMLGGIVQFVFVIAVILALGFIVYGGIQWVTSGGDKDAVAGARGRIIAAVIGLILIVLSYFILNFTLLFLTGSGLENINVPRLIGGSQSGGTDNSRLIQDCYTSGGTPIVDDEDNFVRCAR